MPVRPGEDACVRFAAAEDRRRVAVGVVRDALQRGHRVLYLCDRDDVQGLVSELAALDDAIGPAYERGQLRVRSCADASAQGARVEIERMPASLRDERDLALAEGYAGLTITWEGVLAAARLRSGAVRLAGELDFESAPTLAGVLDAHVHGPLSLDLADLDYVDVTGMRALRGRTEQPLAIVGASQSVRTLIELLAWDTDPGIEVMEP